MDFKEKIKENLQTHLDQLLPRGYSRQIYQYALFPGGKLFRAQLIFELARDLAPNQDPSQLTEPSAPHAYLASSIEAHHTYTLLHDDLPCMDNDDLRRGKPATHKKFGEWQALLCGDGLLNLSYQLIGQIHPLPPTLLKSYAWFVGPRGLIEGQFMDLALGRDTGSQELTRIHTLKTARLIQCALYCTGLIHQVSPQELRDLFKLGHYLGILFQLHDDLKDLERGDQEANFHYQFPQEASKLNKKYQLKANTLLETYGLQHLFERVHKDFPGLFR